MKNFIAGIDLGGTKICTAIADKGGKIISIIKMPTEAEKGKNAVLANIYSSIDQAVKVAGIKIDSIESMGIAVPGPVEYSTGIVRECPNLPGWKSVPVREIFEKKYKCRAVVDNDARVAGLAEARTGAGRNYNFVFYVTVSTGIGGAIIINKEIYHGADGIAGEIGQTRLPDGTIFEKSASGPAIERMFGIKPKDIPALLKENDPKAKAALDHIVQNLGIWLANVATLINPEIIVVGGGLSNLGGILLNPLRKAVRVNAFSVSGKNIKIIKAAHKKGSGIIGALELAR